jgi:hypothetical protein
MGGLGNQLFQFAAGLAAAKNSTLILDCNLLTPRVNSMNEPEILGFILPSNVKLFYGKSNRFLRKLLNISLRLALKREFKMKQVSKLSVFILRKLTNLVIEAICSIRYKTFIRISVPRNVGWDPRENILERNFMYGYFQSYRWFDDGTTLEKMKLMPLKNGTIDLKEYEIRAKNDRPIVLHVRRGDYKLEKDLGLLDVLYYREALRILSRRNSSKVVWVFSDEPSEAKELLDNLDGYNFEFIEEHSEDSCKTLEIMKLGHNFIIANSSFSYWAAILNRQSSANVICPDPWFRSESSPFEIAPKHWSEIKV